MEKFITLKELAHQVGLDRSNLRKYALSKGFKFTRIRTSESRGQLTLALPESEAKRLKDERHREGFSVQGKQGQAIKADKYGYFYVIQVVPGLAPGRVKLGYTNDLKGRLGEFRIPAPTAKIAKTWPCKRSWEPAAIDSASRKGCKPLSREAFDCDSLSELLERCDAFFAVMPSLEENKEKNSIESFSASKTE